MHPLPTLSADIALDKPQGNPEVVVIPAQAGIQNLRSTWAPAFAGVTENGFFRAPLRYTRPSRSCEPMNYLVRMAHPTESA
ncbi:hypothetical protein EGJ44_03495 [Ectopseudomonas oleovorans]|uniref:Uncharacterized protein n=1 Tax=Ectopseudomonas oleovorans TaxID=301 RepID=A0A3R8XXT5_ECTOL|nr:hypothetical protein EGJ44_03495 [Pseudomonas oleovorans]